MTTTISTATTTAFGWSAGDLIITSSGSINTGNNGNYDSAIDVSGTVGDLTNSGTINSTSSTAIVNTGNIGTITNNGAITGGWSFANGASSSQPGTIQTFINNGEIGGSGYGLMNNAGSIGTFSNYGTIDPTNYGVINSGTITTFNNYGKLGLTGYGFINSGTLTTFNNSGTISANYGFLNSGFIGTLNNSGTLTGGFDDEVNATTGLANLVNTGTINGYVYGAVNLAADTQASTSIVNSGTLNGAVTFSPYIDTLTIQGAGVVIGDLVGTAGGQATVHLDPGVGKTYSAQGDFGKPGGVALTAIDIDSGTFWVDGGNINAARINFSGSATGLTLLGNLSGFSTTLAGFAGGDLIYLHDVLASTASLNSSDQLVLSENGSTVATLQLSGNYSGATFNVTPFGPSGSHIAITYSAAYAVTYGPSAAAPVDVLDTASDVIANLTGLEKVAMAGKLASIDLSDAGTPILSINAAQLGSDAAVLQAISTPYALSVSGQLTVADLSVALLPEMPAVGVTDSAANVTAHLDLLQSYAAAGKLSGISLTDNGFGTISLTSAQLAADGAALGDISGNFVLSVSATSASQTISGLAGHATTVVFSGPASGYSVTTSGGEVIVTGAGGTVDHLSGITAIEFGTQMDIVAQTPSATGATSGNVAELYAAVLGRLPDVAGLNYYEDALAANPSLPMTTLAEGFLGSPEYLGNSAHQYAQTTAGDTQFITDTYQNLLGRAPEAGAIPYYLDMITQFTQGLTPGTAAYSSAEKLAHAAILTDFSASAEFLADVSITAQNPSSAKHWLLLVG